MNSLPHGADHTQILATLNKPIVRTLLEDKAGFYTIIIGSPPGIHHTAYVNGFDYVFRTLTCLVRVPDVQKGRSSTPYVGTHPHSGLPWHL